MVSDRGYLPRPLSYTTKFILLHRRVGAREGEGREGGEKKGRGRREEWEVRKREKIIVKY